MLTKLRGGHFKRFERVEVEDLAPGVAQRDRSDRRWRDTKVTDDLVERALEEHFAKLALPNLARRTDCHPLARLVSRAHIDPEVVEELDVILEGAKAAEPRVS